MYVSPASAAHTVPSASAFAQWERVANLRAPVNHFLIADRTSTFAVRIPLRRVRVNLNLTALLPNAPRPTVCYIIQTGRARPMYKGERASSQLALQCAVDQSLI